MTNYCYCCGHEVIWQNDFTFEDLGIEGEGLCSIWHCPNCDADIEVYVPITQDDIDELTEAEEQNEEKSDGGEG